MTVTMWMERMCELPSGDGGTAEESFVPSIVQWTYCDIIYCVDISQNIWDIWDISHSEQYQLWHNCEHINHRSFFAIVGRTIMCPIYNYIGK